MKASAKFKHDTRWVFIKKGTCSRTLFYILNHEFGHPLEAEEKAVDSMAGGIMQQGYQCGQLWGAVMGAGAEVYRRSEKKGERISRAMRVAEDVVVSFTNRAKSTDCYDILDTDLKKNSTLKLMVKGKFLACFKLINKWAPEVIQTVKQSLEKEEPDLPVDLRSCANEVVQKMKGSELQQTIAAGLAGGIGLSGGGCGALGAAIWMHSLQWLEENPGKSTYSNSRAEAVLEQFMKETDYEFNCADICGRKFENVEQHSEFVKQGGCKKLLKSLANT